jgi:hypothetical protein
MAERPSHPCATCRRPIWPPCQRCGSCAPAAESCNRLRRDEKPPLAEFAAEMVRQPATPDPQEAVRA